MKRLRTAASRPLWRRCKPLTWPQRWVETLAGLPLSVTIEGNKAMADDAQILNVDINASNGIIHVIDTVLIPPTE